jgi:uncharacterized Zn finger protein
MTRCPDCCSTDTEHVVVDGVFRCHNCGLSTKSRYTVTVNNQIVSTIGSYTRLHDAKRAARNAKLSGLYSVVRIERNGMVLEAFEV